MNSIFLILLAAVAIGVAAMFLHASFASRRGVFALANAIDTGTHDGALSKVTDAAIGRYIIVKEGTTAGSTVDACGANALPLGVTLNEAAAAAERVPVAPMALSGTKLLTASEAITIGDTIYTAASGKVQNEPGTAGTYYRIGRALTSAAADGDLIEVETHPPIKVVVIAALTSTNGTAAAASASLANLAAEAEKIGDDVRAIAAALATPAEVKVLV
jgi:hypothetical protein